jgi:hypothetical protein
MLTIRSLKHVVVLSILTIRDYSFSALCEWTLMRYWILVGVVCARVRVCASFCACVFFCWVSPFCDAGVCAY